MSYNQTVEKLSWRIGKLIQASKQLEEYVKSLPPSDVAETDPKFLQLSAIETQRKQEVINLSPTAKQKFTNPDDLPTRAPDANKIMFTYILEDAQSGLTNNNEFNSKSLDSLVSPIKVSLPVINNGVMELENVETEDGTYPMPKFETKTIYALNGSNEAEIISNLKEFASQIVSQSTKEVQSMREELDALELKTEMPMTDETEPYKKDEVYRIVEDTLQMKLKGLIENEVQKVLASESAKQIIVRQLALTHYSELYNQYFKEIMKNNIQANTGPDGKTSYVPLTKFGELFLTKVKYFGDSGITEQSFKAVLDSHLFKELQVKVMQHSQTDPGFLENALGNKDESNRIFYNLLESAFDISVSKIIGDNPTLSKSHFFDIRKPENRFEPKEDKNNMISRISDSVNMYNAAMNNNVVDGVSQIVYGNQQPNYDSIPSNVQYNPQIENNQAQQGNDVIDNDISQIPLTNPYPTLARSIELNEDDFSL